MTPAPVGGVPPARAPTCPGGARRRRRARPVLLAGLLLLAACSRQELYGNLDESAANEVVAALQDAGIDADKQAQGKEQWSVAVPDGDFARAVGVLKAAGLPRREYDTLGTVFKKTGYGTSPFEERSRFIFARQQQVRQQLEEIPGVASARVQIAVPAPASSIAATPTAPPSASVVIRYREGFPIKDRVSQVQTIVARGVEGLEATNVTVAMFPTEPSAPRASVGGFRLTTTAWLIPLALMFLLAAVIMTWRRRKGTATDDAGGGTGGATALRLPVTGRGDQAPAEAKIDARR